MKKKIFIYSIVSFVSILILFCLTLYFKMKKSVPNLAEKIQYNGLQKPLEIKTDEFGVPHIIASNKEDLYFGLGYAQARERLFQMQILKRVIAGRISELVGKKGLEVDILFRHIGFKYYSEKWIRENLSSAPQDVVRYIEKYLEGVNSFAATHPLPAEFFVMGMEYEPLEMSDILGFAGFMGFGFGEGLHVDPLITELEEEYGKEKVSELTGDISAVALRTEESREATQELLARSGELKQFMREFGLPLFQGSNSWVLSPKLSQSKSSLFSNDPHIGFSNPSIWFEAYLEAPGFELYGHFLPMVPFAPIAFNSQFAYGLTMFENDDMDFYLEKDNPDNPDEYYIKGNLMKYGIREESIKVRFSDETKIRVKTSIHGTVLTGSAKSLKNRKESIALRWPMYDKNNNPMLAFYGFNTAKNLEDFEKATTHLLAPGLNIVYADNLGNIAYFPCGVIPIRNFPSDRILDGESGKYEWGEYITGKDRPRTINPDKGFIYTANHKHYGKVPYAIAGYWQADDRSERLQKLFSEKNNYSFEDMQSVVLDDTFSGASYILPRFFEVVERHSSELTDIEREALKILSVWDRRGNPEENGALLFSEFRAQLMRDIFLDEFGEERFSILCDTSRIYHFLKKVYTNPTSSWWDNRSTEKSETSDDIILLAFKNSIKTIADRQGKRIENWRWGREHTLELKHPLGDIPLLGKLFNSGPREIGGGSEVINNLLSKVSKGNHNVTAGPSMRTQIDFSNLELIYIINPLGQSGHRLSPHFEDQADMYAKGQFRKISWSKRNSGSPERTTVLSPP